MQSSTFIHARLFHFINARFNDRSVRSPAAMARWIAILFTAITEPIISANRCISPLCRSQSPEYPARSRGSLDFNSNEASERAIRTFLLLLSLSLSRFLTSFAKHPLALYMLCLVYMLVCIFVYQPGTIVAREIDEAVLIGAFGFHLIVARLEWNFNRLNDRSRHRSDDDLFKRMSDDLKRRWNRRFQWKTKKRQVFD